MEIQIKLTPDESEKYFHNSLCNHFGLGGYGLEFTYDKEDYKKAKASLEAKKNIGEFKGTICREDVWMEILRVGGKLKVIDIEGEGTYTREITLKDVHERVSKTPTDALMDAINETDDADTADHIIQTVFFEEVIFG